MAVLAGRGKFRLSKVEHPKFESHMTPNEDEYQKSVQLRFKYCLGVSQFTVSLRITCIPAEEIDFEIGHFRNFWTSIYDIDFRSGHTAYQCVSLIALCLNFLWTDGPMDRH